LSSVRIASRPDAEPAASLAAAALGDRHVILALAPEDC